ncbi:hypothetical protein DAPPUDRAFT_107036 [Daphnia pulex]|uniref:DUF4789 domain-containing protein n=1 Tax=Daphnia pulex TaxID=6669 RepID=E9GVR7_DAPPU|nr:hypothetical protein DAPPUDRAFT_107036 [Daphnia pulex]|eukprot:EFX76457.1 hypothetical protein DAPPUDRAFT_107036 [Daphnia pulex]
MQYSASNGISLTVIVAFTFLYCDEVFCCAPSRKFTETYFNGRYLPIGSIQYCPRNMVLLDGPNNQGFCDCVDDEKHPAFYSDKTGECYFHNTRGPCSDGEWFVLKKGNPVCEPVPEGCPANGRYFYGTPDETMAKRCLKLWKEGSPCLPDEYLQLREGPELTIFCGYQDPMLQSVSLSAGTRRACRPGTLRKRSGHCSEGRFYG